MSRRQGDTLTVSSYTLGCKLNQYDTQVLREAFAADGFKIVPFGQSADVCVVNTCTVTQKSDYQCRQALRRAVRSSPSGIVAAVGCYAQTTPEDLAAIPGVDLVVGTSNRHRLVELVKSYQGGTQVAVHTTAKVWEREGIARFDGRSRALVKIQEGCDQRCAYCVIPLARGPSRSRPFADVVGQCGKLARSGYREIVLTGTHLGVYGQDLPEQKSLLGVLRALEGIEELGRYRLSSIEPVEVSDAMIGFLGGSSKFCRHLHIPLQSGCDETLCRMGRPYAVSDYLLLLDKLRHSIPQIRLGADVMVGFPGEIRAGFEQTYETIERSELNYLHVFPYSARPGTHAAAMAHQVDPQTKKQRCARLRQLGAHKARAFAARFEGQRLTVVFENRPDRCTGLLTGVTDNYLRVLCEGADELMGGVAEVRIGPQVDGGVQGTVVKRLDE